MKITFVCTGNTCRSPMLAAMFADYARKVGFACETDSAGVTGGGNPVNPKTVNVLKSRGINASDGVSKVFDENLAETSDFVFTMTEEQKNYLLAQHADAKVYALCDVCGKDIADPYGREQSVYDALGDEFESLLGEILDFVEKKSAKTPDAEA